MGQGAVDARFRVVHGTARVWDGGCWSGGIEHFGPMGRNDQHPD